MSKQACRKCQFYIEPNCRLYPRGMAVQPGWWCGQYKYRKVPVPKDTRRSDLIAHYCEQHKEIFNNAALIQGPDASAAVAIIKAYDLDGGKAWIDKFLDLDYTPKWNREKRMFRLRDIPAAIQKMSSYDDWEMT